MRSLGVETTTLHLLVWTLLRAIVLNSSWTNGHVWRWSNSRHERSVFFWEMQMSWRQRLDSVVLDVTVTLADFWVFRQRGFFSALPPFQFLLGVQTRRLTAACLYGETACRLWVVCNPPGSSSLVFLCAPADSYVTWWRLTLCREQAHVPRTSLIISLVSQKKKDNLVSNCLHIKVNILQCLAILWIFGILYITFFDFFFL